MTVNGLKMGLETQCCFQPVLPLSARWRRDAGTSAGRRQKKKDTHIACLSFGGEGGIRIIEDGKIVINPVSLNH